MTAQDDPADLDDGDLTLDALTAGVRVFQRRKGHRFSSDDTVTAWVATQVCPHPRRVADLGCGLGSVLLHLAWSVPDATLVGIEAQDVSFALARRNVTHNGLEARVTVHHGDLRDPAVVVTLATAGPFDLVTGTPPYFPPDTALGAGDAQREFARIEHRGGIEAYTATAAHLVASDGCFVVCGDADAAHRADAAAEANGFAVVRHDVVLPRAGRPPLFAVWTMRPAAATTGAAATRPERRVITLRDEAGERTDDARALRAFSGFAEKT